MYEIIAGGIFMKKRLKKIAVLLLSAMLILPMIFSDFANVAYAKPKPKPKHNPKLSCSKKTLTENGETFTLSVNNVKKNVKKIKWYSLNDKVATIQTGKDSNKITVTSVKKGTARIKHRNRTPVFICYLHNPWK